MGHLGNMDCCPGSGLRMLDPFNLLDFGGVLPRSCRSGPEFNALPSCFKLSFGLFEAFRGSRV